MADLSGRDLAWLERRHAELISQVGDFRRGALNAVWRKCGKPNCACAQLGSRDHWPQWNLTRRIGGKTVNVHLKPGPELDKARREVAEHQRFADLVEEVSAVSEVICAARPVSAGTAPPPPGGERGLAARIEEVAAAEVGRLACLAAGLLGSGQRLGVLEQAMRAVLTSAGAGCWKRCWPAMATSMPARMRRARTVTRLVTPGCRAWYHCGECKHGFAPRDQQLGVAGATESPGLAEMNALAGAEVSFARAGRLLSGLAGLTISPRTVRGGQRSGRPRRDSRRGISDPRAADRARCPRPGRCPAYCMSRWTGPACRCAPARPKAGIPVVNSRPAGRGAPLWPSCGP